MRIADNATNLIPFHPPQLEKYVNANNIWLFPQIAHFDYTVVLFREIT